MTKTISLDDLLEVGELAKLKGMPKNVISLSDLLSKPIKIKEAMEVVLFWTDWNCTCGRHYDEPTYGLTLTRFDRYRGGKVIASIYEPYLPVNHCNLPRRVETKHVTITHCPQCIHEDKLEADRQGDLFHATA